MWTRSLLKTNAKRALRPHYWRSVLVCLIAGIFVGGNQSVSSMFGGNSANISGNAWNGEELSKISFAIAGVVFVVAIVALLLAIFVSTTVAVGYARYFMEARIGNAPISTLFSAFQSPGYLNVVKTQFLKGLYIFLWSLLFVIPGIYKAYQYYMVPYILAENPNLPADRVLELSKRMTDGEKFRIFILELSFILWCIPCLLSFGIGFIFLTPYIQATFAELYAALRAKAFEQGVTDSNELGDFMRY